MATYNRAKYLPETLESILAQLRPAVEVVVVDGASADHTQEVMAQYCDRHPQIRYYREPENSGVDRDYDKAVGYARGDYCWLMTDDDILRPNAVQRILSEIDASERVDLIVANAEVKDAELRRTLQGRRLDLYGDRGYANDQGEALFADVADYLSFIGGVIVRRDFWLSRDRASYYGTLFIHIGVIFQKPTVPTAKVLADPLIVIRYGNAMWTPRGFEIWLFKWPKLIWSFDQFSAAAREKVCHSQPWRIPKVLLYYRATGAYSSTEFKRLLAAHARGAGRIIARLVSLFPAALANLLMVIYYRATPMALYDLLRSDRAGWASKSLAAMISGGAKVPKQDR